MSPPKSSIREDEGGQDKFFGGEEKKRGVEGLGLFILII
jgi:hypothetical protein